MDYCFDFVRPKSVHDFENAISFDHFSKVELEIMCYDNASVIPGHSGIGGVFDASDHYIPWSEFWNRTLSVFDGPTELVTNKEDVFYLGMFYCCWGHCLTDDLRHLWPFVKGKIPSCDKFVYTTSDPNEKLPTSFIHLMQHLGIDTEKIERIDKPTRFHRVYCSTPSFWLDTSIKRRYYTQEYVDTINKIHHTCVPVAVLPTRKIYFSRTGWSRNQYDIGENHVEQAFQSKGYEIVRPEELNLNEMVRMLSECKVFAATEGSCAHNAIFLQRGAELIIIRKANYINDYQMAINQCRDLKVTNIDAFRCEFVARPNEPWLGPFMIGVNKHLSRFLGVRSHFYVCNYWQYLYAFIKMRSHVILSNFKHTIWK